MCPYTTECSRKLPGVRKVAFCSEDITRSVDRIPGFTFYKYDSLSDTNALQLLGYQGGNKIKKLVFTASHSDAYQFAFTSDYCGTFPDCPEAP